MNVSVNGTLYSDVLWEDNSLIINTDYMSISEAESAFAPGDNASIVIYENDEIVAKYINKAISSLTVRGSNPRQIVVVFEVTKISEDAEEVLQSAIEDSDGAIEELAEIVSELSELDMSGMTEKLQSHQETIDTWFSNASEISNFVHQLRMDDGILDVFNRRIAALEAAVGALTAPQINVEE